MHWSGWQSRCNMSGYLIGFGRQPDFLCRLPVCSTRLDTVRFYTYYKQTHHTSVLMVQRSHWSRIQHNPTGTLFTLCEPSHSHFDKNKNKYFWCLSFHVKKVRCSRFGLKPWPLQLHLFFFLPFLLDQTCPRRGEILPTTVSNFTPPAQTRFITFMWPSEVSENSSMNFFSCQKISLT